MSTIVSINFFLKNGSNSVWKLTLKLRICVRFASTFNVVRVAVLTYDLVICKDSNDCLGFSIEYSCHTIINIKHEWRLSLQLMTNWSLTSNYSNACLGIVIGRVCNLMAADALLMQLIHTLNSSRLHCCKSIPCYLRNNKNWEIKKKYKEFFKFNHGPWFHEGAHSQLDWLALHLKVGSGIDYLFLEIIRSYVDKFNVFLLCWQS